MTQPRHTLACAAVVAAAVGLLVSGAPAQAACDPAATPPPGFLLQPGDKILFYGDSMSRGHSSRRRADQHFANLLQFILAETYCDFSDFTVRALGGNGHSYRNYARAFDRKLRRIGSDWDWVLFQDTGKALRADIYESSLQDTLDKAATTLPDATVLVATSAPLDVPRAKRGWVKHFGRAEDWIPYNATLETVAASNSIDVVPWAEDFCSFYSYDPGFDPGDTDPVSDITVDGLHPTPGGEVALAVSLLKYFGTPKEDLNLIQLVSFNPLIARPVWEPPLDRIYDGPDWNGPVPASCDFTP